MSGVRVLVTGGTGVVGRATVVELCRRGFEVVVFQRGAVPDDLAALGVSGVQGDVGDGDAIVEAMSGVAAVVHAAGKVTITGAWEDYERINLQGTRTVVDAARHAGVARFVMVSSPSVAHAGEPLVGVGADPADAAHARSHYAKSKAMAEAYALSKDGEGFSVVAIRPHLVWGPGDTQLTARIIDRARAGRLVLIGGGAALIDTTYIDNAGSALVAAVERASDPQVHGKAFVVSNGQPRTVMEMLTRIAEAAGEDGPRRSVPFPVARAGGRALESVWERSGRAGEPPVTAFLAEQLATAHWFDQRQTRAALRWSPQVSLEEGFARLSLALS